MKKIDMGTVMREKKDESYYKENSHAPSTKTTKVDNPKVDILSPFSNL